MFCSLFPAIHLLEAIHTTLFPGWKAFDGPVMDLGLLMASANPVELDALAVHLTGGDPSLRHFLKLGAEVFGTWDKGRFPEPPVQYRAFFNLFGSGT